MAEKSILQETHEIQMAIELISLGARLQLLESETCISRGKLTKLFREIKGVSPPKGQLPFSADWFMTWEQNVHASLFYNIYRHIRECDPKKTTTSMLIKAYRLYLEYLSDDDKGESLFSLTRAWTLIRFVDSGILSLTRCNCCGGKFITYLGQPAAQYACPMCRPPSRALKKRKQTQPEHQQIDDYPAAVYQTA